MTLAELSSSRAVQEGVIVVKMRSSRSTSLLLAILVVAVTFFCSSSLPTVSAQAPASAPASGTGRALCDTTFALHNGTRKTYTQCQNLGVQNATLAWNFFPGDNVTGGVLDLAFTDVMLNSKGWVGWGLTYANGEMIGASALVAFFDSSASGGSIVLPYKLTSSLADTNPPPLVSGPSDLDVLHSSVDIDATTLVTTIYATLQLKPGATNLFHLWNKGPSVTGRSPNSHDQVSNTFMTSFGGLNVLSGTVVPAGAPSNLPNVHGFLNAISWGVLFPIGIMSARYMRPFALFDPIWFYVHVGSQVSGYILGVAGFATGLKILDPNDVKYKHRNLGIALFVFATLNVAALLIRPGRKHSLRKVFNVYHHTFGYTIVILSIINIFEGFKLLQPAKGWKRAYIGVIIALGAIAFVLEVFTWTVWVRRQLKAKNATAPANSNSDNSIEQGLGKPDVRADPK